LLSYLIVIALAGGQDHTINAYHVDATRASTSSTLSPDYTLLGHEDNVCALHVHEGKSSYIVSGSWDKTARVWKDWQSVAVLQGHTQAVWAVLALDDDTILTASADKIIRQFSISEAIKGSDEVSKPVVTYVGHEDAVRGLLRIDATTFASCGNDGNIHVYDIANGASRGSQIKPRATLSGHTSFVYSLAALNDDDAIASSGEDRSVRVWENGGLRQVITVPAISVWSVDALSNGDVACASSDGFVRIFTKTPQRYADDDILAAYDAAVSSQSLNKAQVGDIQKDSLPGIEALQTPGKEGQVKMIRTGDLVEAHQYSAASGGWEKIGEVVGGVGSSQKKLHDGKEHDYVFDVDIADGVPPLKLPYNASENPYVAAQRFLEKNEMPLTYLDQVVQFIEKNTSGVSLGGGNEYRDPYTGASSYRPGGSIGGSIAAPSPSNTIASTTPKPTPPTTAILPHRTPLMFKQFNAQGAKSKITELNGKVDGTAAMTGEEMTDIDAILASLSLQGGQVDQAKLDVLVSVMQRWPASMRFPLLDVYRMACSSLTTGQQSAAITALQAAQWNESWPTSSDEVKARTTSALLALRSVANALSSNSSQATLPVLQCVQQGSAHVERLSKAARVAYATVLLNAAILLLANIEAGLATVLLSLIDTLLKAELSHSHADRDAEAIYRATMALGNVLVSPSAGSLGMGEVQSAVQGAHQAVAQSKEEDRLQVLWREIESKSSVI
jgi:phospholipase A-2-activating protein